MQARARIPRYFMVIVMDLMMAERRFPGFYCWSGGCRGCRLVVDLREAGQGTFMVDITACRL